MESLLLKHMQYISVLTLQNDFIQLSELLMHCDRAIYSNSHRDAWKIHADILWTHLWSLLHSRSLASARHAHQQRKHAFFKVDVSQLYLFHLQTLEYYLEQSQRTLSLMNSSQRLCKKTHTHMRTHLHNMFDVPLQMMCYLLLCDWRQIVRVLVWADEKLILQSGLA